MKTAAPASSEHWTVGHLNREVKAALAAAFPQSIWLAGEISGFNRSRHKKHVGFCHRGDAREQVDDDRGDDPRRRRQRRRGGRSSSGCRASRSTARKRARSSCRAGSHRPLRRRARTVCRSRTWTHLHAGRGGEAPRGDRPQAGRAGRSSACGPSSSRPPASIGADHEPGLRRLPRLLRTLSESGSPSSYGGRRPRTGAGDRVSDRTLSTGLAPDRPTTTRTPSVRRRLVGRPPVVDTETLGAWSPFPHSDRQRHRARRTFRAR